MHWYTWFIIWFVGFVVSLGYTFRSYALEKPMGTTMSDEDGWGCILTSFGWPIALFVLLIIAPIYSIGGMIAKWEHNREQKKLLARKQALLEQEQLRKEIEKIEQELNLLKE